MIWIFKLRYIISKTVVQYLLHNEMKIQCSKTKTTIVNIKIRYLKNLFSDRTLSCSIRVIVSPKLSHTKPSIQ